ncbi:MAG: hypothetical protein J7647_26955 [Cyanobacteria bacterium SBLK]|nr:hypothetical protein [Cyanobacteria bacterium SBLK]
MKNTTLGNVVAVVAGFACIGFVTPTEAAIIRAGSDYVRTPAGGSTFNFEWPDETIVPVDFEGLAIDPDNLDLTDTVIERKDTLDLDIGETGTTNIEIVALSLQSVAPVTIPDMMGNFDVFVTLDPTLASVGTMDITRDSDEGGTWSSSFTLNFKAFFRQGTNVIDAGPISPKTFSTSGNQWTHQKPSQTTVVDLDDSWNFDVGNIWGFDPGDEFDVSRSAGAQTANCHVSGSAICDPGDFFLDGLSLHDAGDGTHTVSPFTTPEPTGILGLGVLGLGALYQKVRSQKNQEPR